MVSWYWLIAAALAGGALCFLVIFFVFFSNPLNFR